MASTRDKRLKTDSPTPVAASETAATTPTTKSASTAIKLKRMSRNRSGILSAKSENEDGNDSVGLSEDTQSSTASVEPPKTPNTRTKRQPAKDEKEEEVVAESKEESPTAKDAAADSKRLTKAQLLKQKGAELAQARKDALLKKRNSLPLPVKSSTRNNSSLRLSSGAKVESAKEETQVTPKKGKPGRKAAEKKAEEAVEPQEEDTEANDDAESVTEKSEDKIDDTNDTEAVPDITIKQEKLDKSAAAIAIDLLNVRRSTRQRKSTIKDRDSPFTGRKSQVRDKSEAKRDSISPAISIKAEKESSKEITITVNEAAVEKDPSLSPELVSEEMDTESVQHLYDKPDFLENNLGIEQDPKLGDMVKVQEKTKVVEVIKNEEATVIEEETIAADDVEMKDVEEKQEELKEEEIVEEKVEEKMEIDEKVEEKIVEKVEKVNGEKLDVAEEKEEAKTKEEEKPKLEVEEEEEEEIKSEKDSSMKDEESSGEENKENNVESSAKSIGSNSPRSEDSLKIVSEENVPKFIDPNPVETELLKQKESHLLSLGLYTHKAAGEAKIAKQKRKEEFAKNLASNPTQGRKKKENSGEPQYTGTLKTIIKLNRTEKEKRKTRMPLKMTFQKKNRDRDSNGSANSSDSFYTIQDKDGVSPLDNQTGAISRKSHNRSYNHDQVAPSNEQNQTHEPVVNKEIDQSLVIPEKASSFKVHPERLCKDQCFYCGGKFGLYDTPCHIAQIKSDERQKKILESEEKLTKDSCLCDACFRHVDRRANCPSYKSKRIVGPAFQGASSSNSPQNQQQNNFDRTYGICNVIDCHENAVHNIRKKWFMKMKKTIAKIFQIDMDIQPTNANVSICEEHFSALSHIMVCAMCKRKLPRNHIFYINQDIVRLEHLITEQGMHIKLSNSTLVVCKLCSYYNNLLFKPPEPKTQKADFVKNYTKKLLKHNSLEGEQERRQVITVEDDDVQEIPNRDPNLTLTIRNGKIQPKKQLSKEVTITSMKSPAAGGSIMLDNDVMVGYDVPFPLGCESPNDVPVHAIRNPNYKGPPQKSKDQMVKKKKDDNNEMARVLKSNPNISMRELFPGEEEMGLNVTMPFNTSAAQRTADGWFKAQMTVQYDEVTKALWESLQRPYGNSSSFLRHLVLLEKYFRNGDLVLSQSASNSAITYSESVRNRLRSYDNIPSSSPISKTSFSNEISIIPTQKVKKPNDSLTITPQPGNSLLKRKASQNDVNSPKQKAMRVEDGTPKKTSPPELISFVQKPAVKKAKEMSESPPAFMSPSISITATNSSSSTNSQTSTSNGNVIVLPQSLTPGDRKLCTKSWRPTLIPITSGTTTPTTGGQLYQTADGRKLPELVQVMSGGKPYHISINDYNRMCIIRREKLMSQKQRLQSQPENGNANMNTFTSTNSLSIIPMSKDKDGSFRAPAPSTSPKDARRVLNIPNQFLEQNSLIPLESNGKRHQNGIGSLPPPLTSFKGLPSSMNLLSMPPSLLPSALSDLSKTVNSLQPAQQLAAWKALWNDTDLGNNSDNVAALAQIANLASMTQHLTSGMMDTALLSKIPKSLTVIPQAKSNRHASDESRNNSAST